LMATLTFTAAANAVADLPSVNNARVAGFAEWAFHNRYLFVLKT
jgi:hypothetical protein